MGKYTAVEHEQTATYIIQIDLKSVMLHQKVKLQRLTHAIVPFKQNFKISVIISIQHRWTHILQVLTNESITF